jgi:hypothetical protein
MLGISDLSALKYPRHRHPATGHTSPNFILF